MGFKKLKKETELADTKEAVKKTAPKEKAKESTDDSEYINAGEKKALSIQQSKDEADKKAQAVSTEKVEKATAVVQDAFNLGGKKFSVDSFKDKGASCQLSMSNDDFDLSVCIKDTEKFGIM